MIVTFELRHHSIVILYGAIEKIILKIFETGYSYTVLGSLSPASLVIVQMSINSLMHRLTREISSMINKTVCLSETTTSYVSTVSEVADVVLRTAVIWMMIRNTLSRSQTWSSHTVHDTGLRRKINSRVKIKARNVPVSVMTALNASNTSSSAIRSK
jgi:hypothetical protein